MIKNSKKTTVVLVGAGGKMGMRCLNNLLKHDYKILLCENGAAGLERLKDKGLTVTPNEEAIPSGDYIIMAVPDAKLGKISETAVPMMKPGATMITLDPAAAFAKELTLRDDCTFVVTHPCHPGLFVEQDTPEARSDMFGGIAAKQDIVIAFMQGEEENFLTAEKICKEMFAPVVYCHRITVEQMAMLEPAAAEVVAASAACLMKEALDEVIKRGVPEAAAKAFMMGHIQIPLAIVFKNVNPFSDAAKIAIKFGYEHIYRPDWKKIFEMDSIKEQVHRMIHPEEEE
ncbi:MAG TPA: phosphogluconate dehydrogenase C-terminal domain-containing protein [Clostridia bacterium]|nr:phosphogluconate dehydrogenase C-terminal domain-containing protein [Clostridia bacterium]